LSGAILGKYRLELNRLHTYLESANIFLLEEVTLPHLTGYRATWTELYQASITRRMVQNRLKTFFKYAALAYDLRRNPAQGLSTIRVEKSPTLPFTEPEYQAILEAIPHAFPETKPLRTRKLADQNIPRPRSRTMLTFVQLMHWSGLAIRDTACLERDQIQIRTA
jgi:site-specific recombinase XerD